MTLAVNVRAAREAAGHTQESLARTIRCSTSSIERIEQGTNTNPTTALLKAIADECSVSIDSLLDSPKANTAISPATEGRGERRKGGV